MFVTTAPRFSTRAFTRYVFAVQYHGGDLLGLSYQGPRVENSIIYEKHSGQIEADLRGIESVEGRIRRALGELVGNDNYSNIRVSSRTDRGVHAWRNTFQVDIRPRLRARKAKAQKSHSNIDDGNNQPLMVWKPRNLVHGLNFFLSRLSNYPSEQTDEDCSNNDSNTNNNDDADTQMQQNAGNPQHLQNLSLNTNICITSSAVAPDEKIPNLQYDPNLPENDANPKSFPWDIRYTATRRTYAYQILHSHDDALENDDNQHSTVCFHSQPFEHDRAWRIHEKREEATDLDINAMNIAGQHLVGTHDFSSFRGKGCQRTTPVVTLEDVWVGQESYHSNGCGSVLGGVWRRPVEGGKENAKYGYQSRGNLASMQTPKKLKLITIVITGKSFVYHQVRNIVACLVDVGRGRLKTDDVKEILEKKDRRCAPGMAPAKGLFLVDVEHGDFRF